MELSSRYNIMDCLLEFIFLI